MVVREGVRDMKTRLRHLVGRMVWVTPPRDGSRFKFSLDLPQPRSLDVIVRSYLKTPRKAAGGF